MCLGSLYHCNPCQVIYIAAREDYMPFYRDDRKHFAPDTFYVECAKSIGERCLPMMQEKDETAIAVHRRWRELNA